MPHAVLTPVDLRDPQHVVTKLAVDVGRRVLAVDGVGEVAADSVRHQRDPALLDVGERLLEAPEDVARLVGIRGVHPGTEERDRFAGRPGLEPWSGISVVQRHLGVVPRGLEPVPELGIVIHRSSSQRERRDDLALVPLPGRDETQGGVEAGRVALALAVRREQLCCSLGPDHLRDGVEHGAAVPLALLVGGDHQLPEEPRSDQRRVWRVRPDVPAQHHETHRHAVDVDAARPRVRLGVRRRVPERVVHRADVLLLLGRQQDRRRQLPEDGVVDLAQIHLHSRRLGRGGVVRRPPQGRPGHGSGRDPSAS